MSRLFGEYNSRLGDKVDLTERDDFHSVPDCPSVSEPGYDGAGSATEGDIRGAGG